jgi:hypothetical protein
MIESSTTVFVSESTLHLFVGNSFRIDFCVLRALGLFEGLGIGSLIVRNTLLAD